jgi:cyclopropane fatty-acyl-phospholipid synthase-like methyltransferase
LIIKNLDDAKKKVHSGFSKEKWIEAHDFMALNNPWDINRKTPLNTTLEQAKHRDFISWYEQISEDTWPIKEGTMLELGCHWGRFSIYKALTTNLEVYACDASRVVIDHVKELSNKLGCSNLHCSVMFAEDIETADDFFDVIYAFETLEHVGDLDRSLKELRRACKKGGHIVFGIPLLSYHDGGFHTQKHDKEFWMKKFGDFFKVDKIIFPERDNKKRILGRLVNVK